METKSKLLLALSLVLLGLALMSLLSPFFVARGIALWLRYEARRSGLIVTVEEIRAPFLRPVEIRGLRVIRPGVGGANLEMECPRLEAVFHLAAFLIRSERARPLRLLHIEHARVALRGRALESAGKIDWQTLSTLVPEEFDFSADQLLFQQSFGRLEVHDAHITGHNGRSGTLAMASVELRGRYLQKNFADLQGVTRWQDARLSIGSIHLLEGFDIDSLALDFTRLRATRIAAEIGVTIFSGSLRANFATERTSRTRIWEGAGSASGISLSQLARAVGLIEPITGSLRASKITFRGDPRDLLHATGSLWTELTGFSWRDRNADVIMVGADFYERTIQLQELYIKQRLNELTLSGETTLGADWLSPDFRGDISGSINDLGQFAELFGAGADAFAGKIAVRGRVHAHERRVDGDLGITGDALKIFRNPVDSLTARLTLDSPRVHLDQFELRRGEDFLRGSGQIDFAHERTFVLSADSSCGEVSDYRLRVPLLGALSGSLFAQLDASGNESASTVSLSAETAAKKFSVHGTLRGEMLALDALTMTINGTTAPFTGSINVRSPKNLTLAPIGELRLGQDMNDDICLRGIELHQQETGIPLSQIVIAAHQVALTDALSQTQTRRLCSDDESTAQPLQINVPAPTPTPTPLPTP